MIFVLHLSDAKNVYNGKLSPPRMVDDNAQSVSASCWQNYVGNFDRAPGADFRPLVVQESPESIT